MYINLSKMYADFGEIKEVLEAVERSREVGFDLGGGVGLTTIFLQGRSVRTQYRCNWRNEERSPSKSPGGTRGLSCGSSSQSISIHNVSRRGEGT